MFARVLALLIVIAVAAGYYVYETIQHVPDSLEGIHFDEFKGEI